jgi:cation diffusion facilitator CzcD-associated flavoprotein CzcO
LSILDKNDDVGGTWHESVYPGCRVDNPNHNYSYSFAQRHDWPFHYSTQDVLHDYFRQCADAFGVRRHIRFNCTCAVRHLGRRHGPVDGPLHHADGQSSRSRPTPSSAPSAS